MNAKDITGLVKLALIAIAIYVVVLAVVAYVFRDEISQAAAKAGDVAQGFGAGLSDFFTSWDSPFVSGAFASDAATLGVAGATAAAGGAEAAALIPVASPASSE